MRLVQCLAHLIEKHGANYEPDPDLQARADSRCPVFLEGAQSIARLPWTQAEVRGGAEGWAGASSLFVAQGGDVPIDLSV